MTDNDYRPISEADQARFIAIESQAFGDEPANVERWLNNEPGGDTRGLFDGGRLVAQLMLFPFQVMAGPRDVACGGLGSVATPPEERRRGYVERLLRESCAEMRERHMPLCLLFPFKASFYRRFGWATCMERRVYSGRPDLFSSFLRQQCGRFEPVGEAQIAELDTIYAGALRGRFGPLRRNEAWWRRQVLSDGKKPYYAYVWRDEHGRGRAYVIYRWEKRLAGNAMVCREIVALDPEARAQLFGFIANHDSQSGEVVFRAPADAPVNLLLPDPLACEIEAYFMLRLVDVAAALAAYPFPNTCTGRLTLAVADDWLPDNAGVFELEVARGAAQVRRLADSATPDLSCDVRVLAQLYSRYLRPRTAAAFGVLEAPNRDALAFAEQLFAGLAPFSSDFF